MCVCVFDIAQCDHAIALLSFAEASTATSHQWTLESPFAAENSPDTCGNGRLRAYMCGRVHTRMASLISCEFCPRLYWPRHC